MALDSALVLPVDEVVLVGTESSDRGNRRGEGAGLGSRIAWSETSSEADTSDSETGEALEMSNIFSFLFNRWSSVSSTLR